MLRKSGTVDTIALDKTGTITVGSPRVTDVLITKHDGASPDQEELLNPEERMISLAAALERVCEHPLAEAAMALSSFSVIVNSLRLRQFKLG